MEFEFGKYTEITDFAHKISEPHKAYDRIFICPDVTDFWLVRVQKGINEDYEEEEGVWLAERDKISKDFRTEKLSVNRVREIIENDQFENWDLKEYRRLKDLIDDLADIFGILNLKGAEENATN